ncbi:GNAT family N-acetyltransferase [Acinetobacter nectaris]|uniref:GNAT family N-acetyltransferase n=1 Tax=Acinetobacter nectaris TaxID=1219382 RepID=UPI001F31EC9F|nr:GNAT family N-acetyltransferase [Acinetobacter nectaris]MCF8998267.1 GNAT family N-acetyltransferase [Acinetobacter nectaris]MCF9027881.1 GNAT family N-acetyltransferase [Acinetobacter nectaris]
MTAIEILEIHDIQNSQHHLSDLLQNTVDGGASIGFLSPITNSEILDYWNEVNDELANGTRKLWVAIQNRNIVGSIQLSMVNKKNGLHRANIEKLMVSSSVRKQGIATLLMNQLESFAKINKLHLLILDTREGDISENLYQKLRFIRVGVIPNFGLSSSGTYDGTAIYYKNIQ